MSKEVTRVVTGIATGGISEIVRAVTPAFTGQNVKGTNPETQIRPVEQAATNEQKAEVKELDQDRRRKARQAQTLLTSRATRESSVATLSPTLGRKTLG